MESIPLKPYYFLVSLVEYFEEMLANIKTLFMTLYSLDWKQIHQNQDLTLSNVVIVIKPSLKPKYGWNSWDINTINVFKKNMFFLSNENFTMFNDWKLLRPFNFVLESLLTAVFYQQVC